MAPYLSALEQKADEQIFFRNQKLLTPELMKKEQENLQELVRDFLVELGNAPQNDPVAIKHILEKYRSGEWRKETHGEQKHLLEIEIIHDDSDSCEDHLDSYIALIAEGDLSKYIEINSVSSSNIRDILFAQKENESNGLGGLCVGKIPNELVDIFPENKFNILAVKVTGYDLDGKGDEIKKGANVLNLVSNGLIRFPENNFD